VIGRISGALLEKHPPQVLVEAGGVGYELDVPMSSFYNLPAVGERVTLHTHFVVREDAQLLYGFLTLKERSAFRELIKITGVGPKMALAVLSGMNVDELAQCVALQETARLTRVPGIGKKTAERLLLELKGKLADALPQATGGAGSPAGITADALNALLALGYSDKEAVPALKQVAEGASLEEAIRQALKLLARKG
jgi:Holliday junction DNA helicase RuvA